MAGREVDAVVSWVDELGWENLVNKRSTSWKALDQKTRDTMDAKSAVGSAVEVASMAGRLVVSGGGLEINKINSTRNEGNKSYLSFPASNLGLR